MPACLPEKPPDCHWPPVLSQKAFEMVSGLASGKRSWTYVRKVEADEMTDLVLGWHVPVSSRDAEEEAIEGLERLWVGEDLVLVRLWWGMHLLEDVFGERLRESGTHQLLSALQ